MVSYTTACQSVKYTIPKSSSVNLDKIKILSSGALNSLDENQLMLSMDSNNKISTDVLIVYRKENTNLLEDIESGKVLEHKITVRNARGEILAESPIDTGDIRAIEFLYQKINFNPKNLPAIGDYLSIQLEMTYVAPFIDLGCAENNTSCLKLRETLNSANFASNHLQSKEQIDSDRNAILSKIKSINQSLSPLLTSPEGTTVQVDSPLVAGDVTSVIYREWKLFSTPSYFKIMAILKDGKQIDESKPEVFELPELPDTSNPNQKETDRTFQLEKEQKPLKPLPSRRRKKSIYLP